MSRPFIQRRHIAGRAWRIDDGRRWPNLTAAARLSVAAALWALLASLTVAQQPMELRGHTGTMMASRFTPQGQAALTVGGDHTVRLWDLESGAQTQVYREPTGPVLSLAVSQDGQTFAAGGQDNAARAWRLPLPLPKPTVQASVQPLTALALGPKGLWLIAADATGEVIRYELHGSAENALAKLPGPGSGVTHIAYRADGFFYATADQSGTVGWWSPFLDQPQRVSHATGQPLVSFDFHPNNQELIATSPDGSVRFWDASPRPSPAAVATGQPVLSQAISADGNQFLLGLADGQIVTAATTAPAEIQPLVTLPAKPLRMAHLASQPTALATVLADGRALCTLLDDPTRSVPYPTTAVTSLVAFPDGQRVATGGRDGMVRVWQRPPPAVVLAASEVNSLYQSSDAAGQWLVSLDQDQQLRVWEIATASVKQTLAAPASASCLALHPQASLLVVGDRDGQVSWWNPADPSQQGKVKLTSESIMSVAFQASTNSLIVNDKSGNLTRWGLPLAAEGDATIDENLQPVWKITLDPPNAVTRMKVADATGEVVFIAGGGKQLARYSATGEPLPGIPASDGSWQDFDIDRAGQKLILLDALGGLYVGDLATAELTQKWTVDSWGQHARLSPQGNFAALALNETSVLVLDLSTGQTRELHVAAHPYTNFGWVGTDDQRLAISRLGATSITTSALQQQWSTGDRPVTAMDVLPNQAQLLVGTQTGELKVWTLANEEPDNGLHVLGGEVVDIETTPDGQFAAVVTSEPELHVLQLSNRDSLLSRPLRAPVSDLAMSPDGQRLATCAEDGTVDLFDRVTGTMLESFQDRGGKGQVDFVKDGDHLLNSGDAGQAHWPTVQLRRWLQLESAGITRAALCGNGGQLIVIEASGKIQQYELGGGKVVRDLGQTLPPDSHLAVSSDQQRVAAGTPQGQVWLWNLGNGSLEQTLETQASLRNLSLSPDHLKLAVVDEANVLTVYGPPPANPNDLANCTQHLRIRMPAPIRDLRFTSDSGHIWTADEQGRLHRWTYASPAQVRQFNHGGPVFGVALSNDGSTLYTASGDQTVRGFDVTNGQQKFQLRGHVGAVLALDLSDDESLIVSSGADGTLRLWDAVGGRALKQLTKMPTAFYTVDIEPAGQRLAAAGEDRQVYLVNVGSGEIEKIFKGHEDFIHSVTFNPAGNRLASYGYAGALKIWDVASGELRWESQVGEVGNSVAYSADGSRLILAGGDGVARVIDLPPAAK